MKKIINKLINIQIQYKQNNYYHMKNNKNFLLNLNNYNNKFKKQIINLILKLIKLINN